MPTDFGIDFESWEGTNAPKVAGVLTDFGDWRGTTKRTASLKAGTSGSSATSGKCSASSEVGGLLATSFEIRGVPTDFGVWEWEVVW